MAAIFEEPTRSNIKWPDIESLFKACGAESIKLKSKTGGSRKRFKLNNVKGFFHRPHPKKEADKGCVEDVRLFLERAGIKP